RSGRTAFFVAEPARVEGAADGEGLVQQGGVFPDAPPEQLADVACVRTHAQTARQAGAVEADEQLHVVPLALLAAPAEGDPQDGLVRHRLAVIVLADAGQRPAAAGRRLQVPAVSAPQHRLDVPFRERLAEFGQRLAHGEAVALALAVHPLAAVV